MAHRDFSKILSKSDFKVARSCPTKLYYKKKGYPTLNEENEYLEYLAEGGYAVGELATMHFPEGIRIQNELGLESAISQTLDALQQENITLFEAAILVNDKVAAIDILVKKGNHFEIIEVKSKSYDSDNPGFKKEWEEYLEDIAFQRELLQEAFPDARIDAFLFVPDKAKRTSIEGLNTLFELQEVEAHNKFKFYNILFLGDPEEIRRDEFMVKVNVNEQVSKLSPIVKNAMKLYSKSLQKGEKLMAPLNIKCFGCEYNHGEEKNGFRECWRGMPEPEHHIRDVFRLGNIKEDKESVADRLISGKNLSMDDLPEKAFEGTWGERRLIQIKNTRNKTEWISQELKDEISTWKYPLHFIDFETSITALPFHKGMRPYEMCAFQWSCHTINQPGAEPIHGEWLNVEPSFPSFVFAESLMEKVGTEGTFLMWATHENTTLRNIYHQMEEYGYQNPKLEQWLKQIVRFDKNDNGAFIDMNDLTLKHYFHPLMKGRTSIKVTLPAVLAANGSQRTLRWLKEFDEGVDLLHYDADGNIEDPYHHLPKIDLIEKAEIINGGTGAMRAYEDMLFGKSKHIPEIKEAYEKALLRYCKLDTLAMVIIWEHWKSI
jgi:hypothetical protein